MPVYRIHCLGTEVPDETFEATDDAEALALAQLRLVPLDCELWCGARFVAALPKDGGRPILASLPVDPSPVAASLPRIAQRRTMGR